jgi:NAD+ dependent glucose-6-phosphate dehydrogenase
MARVLLTGANGDIGHRLVRHLQATHELRLGVGPALRTDMEPVEFLPTDDVREIDVLDRRSLSSAMQGVEVVVHLAGQRSFYASWEDLHGPNIDGVFNIFSAAAEAGVRKVVYASSNHVTGGYDLRRLWPVGSDMAVWPDSLYGVTKAFGEALGCYFAYERRMSVICLRIGWVVDRPHNELALRLWLSPDDLCRLVDCCLNAVVQFGVYYRVSANTRGTYNMAPARRDLGYVPQDDSERYAVAVLGQEGASTSKTDQDP